MGDRDDEIEKMQTEIIDRHSVSENRLVSFVAVATTGGVFATLAFLGTTVGSENAEAFQWIALLSLGIFVFGLYSVLRCLRFDELGLKHFAAHTLDSDVGTVDSQGRLKLMQSKVAELSKGMKGSIELATIALVLGYSVIVLGPILILTVDAFPIPNAAPIPIPQAVKGDSDVLRGQMGFGMSSEFWAVIVGALIAGTISFCIQLFVLRAARLERIAAADDRKNTLAHSLLFKMIKIHSRVHQLNTDFENAYKEHSDTMEPFQFLMPLANIPEDIHFSTDEMTMLLALKNDNLFNDMANLDEIHNSDMMLYRTFNERRSALTSMFPSEMEGKVGTTSLTEDQVKLFNPKRFEVNDLANQMKERFSADAGIARTVLQQLHQELRRKLEFKIGLDLGPQIQSDL